MVLNKNFLLIAYKLLNDLLFILLIFFAGALIADGLVPGLISDHFSFLRLILVVFFNMAAIYLIAQKLDIPSAPARNKKTTIFLSIVAALVIFNGLFEINLYLAIFISILSLIIFYLIYKNLFEAN